MRLNEEVSSIEPIRDEHGDRVKIHLASGKQVVAEKALYSIGRTGNTSKLNLTAAGLAGRRSGPSHGQRALPDRSAEHLRSRRCDRIPEPRIHLDGAGRLAACHAFHVDAKAVPELFPYGIYTIPGNLHGRKDRRGTDAERGSL